MIYFTPSTCEVKTTIKSLKKFANDTYFKYHKSSRAKHMVLGDERYPNLKITDDIFSLVIWIITDDGEEQRIFLDGDVFLNQLTIHTISTDGSHFSEESFEEFNTVLKGLTKIGEGFIYAEVQKSPVRYENGKTKKYNELIGELYNSLSDDKKHEFKELYEVLSEGFVFEE